MRTFLQKVWPKTLIEWLILIAIVAILVALLLPPVKWASSGSVTIPVDIVVFDAMTAAPIEGADVAIVWAPPATGEFQLHEYTERISPGLQAMDGIAATTNDSGMATIDHEFRTGANYERPQTHAHTRWYWLLVSADGYGTVAVPLRYESMTSAELRRQGRLPAYVGLVRFESE